MIANMHIKTDVISDIAHPYPIFTEFDANPGTNWFTIYDITVNVVPPGAPFVVTRI